jgi:hypothetical protein
MTTESYINEQYSRTRWPFFNLMKLLNRFGETGREELKKLREQGKVTHRMGANYYLVQLLITEEGEILNKEL